MSPLLSRARPLVIAGTASGVGKTTVMVGLTLALKARGLKLAVFKCGPDYLDPSYHQKAADCACHNLDGWLMGRSAVLDTYARASQDCDVALIEGVMGLYDSAGPRTAAGSTAEIAKWLDAPVVLVVDAKGMARSIAATVLGFQAYDLDLRLCGVVANRVGSKGHYELLGKALDIPCIGALPKAPEVAFAERYLGLASLRNEDGWQAPYAALADLVEEWWDIPALLRLLEQQAPARLKGAAVADAATDCEAAQGAQRPAGGDAKSSDRDLAWQAYSPARTVNSRCRIAIARDAAFDFYYDDNLARLISCGAELLAFSPLSDTCLPVGTDLIYLGGGYPERHAAALAANAAMLAAIHAHAAAGRAIYAECGGLMYLTRGIVTLDGSCYPLLGLVAGWARMFPQLKALGYVEVETQRSTMLGGAGTRFRGHQFRYSELEIDAGDDAGQGAYRLKARRSRGESIAEGYGNQHILASYVHAHWASNPQIPGNLVQFALQVSARLGSKPQLHQSAQGSAHATS